MTTAVQDRLSFADADTAARVKRGLGIPEGQTAYDAELADWFDAACELADAYMHNPFTNSDGTDKPIPGRVVAGIIELMRIDWLRRAANLELEHASKSTTNFDGVEVSLSAAQRTRSVRREDGHTTTFHTTSDSLVRQRQVPVALTEKQIKFDYFGTYKRILGA